MLPWTIIFTVVSKVVMVTCSPSTISLVVCWVVMPAWSVPTVTLATETSMPPVNLVSMASPTVPFQAWTKSQTTETKAPVENWMEMVSLMVLRGSMWVVVARSFNLVRVDWWLR